MKLALKFYGFRDRFLESAITYGAENKSRLDKLCAILLAISPLLQHYKGIYKNAGLTVLILLVPYLGLKLFLSVKEKRADSYCLFAISPLLLFQLYKMVDHTISVSKILYALVMVVFFVSIACGCVNIKYFMKCTTLISSAAGICLIAQYIFYYILGFHLQMVPTQFLLPESNAWILGAKTGLYGVNGKLNGFYRPSAFFLEPSHLFLYTFPVLCILLLAPNINKRRKKRAILVTIAMVLSTSGMSVAVAGGIWILYFALFNSGNSLKNVARLTNLFSPKNIVILFFILIMLVVAYFQVDVFKNMIDRIFSSGPYGGSTAIEGRTRLARLLVQGVSGSDLIFGVTENVDEITFNLSGFYATLYKYGLIGIFLSYLFYASGLFKLRGAGFWVSAIILVISFFTAHTHGTFYMTYFVLVIMNEYHMRKVSVTGGG